MKYRKPDQFYIDQHDRFTIDYCTEMYDKHWSGLASLAGDDPQRITFAERALQLFIKMEYCLRFWKEKRGTIEKWMKEDERKDTLLKTSVPPSEVQCDVCSHRMEYQDHIFDHKGELVFIFYCSDGKHPRTMIYRDGSTVARQERVCPRCGGPVTVKKSRKKKRQITVYAACTECTYDEVDTMDLTSEPVVIDEAERAEYCLTDESGTQLERELENLQALALLAQDIEAKNQDEELRQVVKQIQRLTVPQLESFLARELASNGYTKLNLDPPQVGRSVFVPFTVQDSQSRESRKSVLSLSKLLQNILLLTNWRLVDPQYSVTCRLGIISGRLKAYESEEEIEKIAGQVLERMNENK